MRTIHWHNKYHLGDCVYHLHYMQHLQDANLQEQFVQEFYCNAEYHAEMKNLNRGYDRITFEPYKPVGIDCWVGQEYNELKACGLNTTYSYNDIYNRWWNELSDTVGMLHPFIGKYDVLNDNPDFLDGAKTYPIQFYSNTILVICPEPKSGQWKYDQSAFGKFIANHKGMDVILIKDKSYNLLEIGQIARHCKYIVGIDTGPMSTALNKWSVRDCKGIYICHNYNHYDYGKNVHMIRTNEELSNLILD